VRSEVVLERRLPSFSHATVYVRLEDVSRVDAPSTTVDEHVLTSVSHRQGDEDRLSVDLSAPAASGRESYGVRVHVDVDGDGQVSRGDLISVESYPVLTFGHPDVVEVRLREV
jgi:hypothetical protein